MLIRLADFYLPVLRGAVGFQIFYRGEQPAILRGKTSGCSQSGEPGCEGALRDSAVDFVLTCIQNIHSCVCRGTVTVIFTALMTSQEDQRMAVWELLRVDRTFLMNLGKILAQWREICSQFILSFSPAV